MSTMTPKIVKFGMDIGEAPKEAGKDDDGRELILYVLPGLTEQFAIGTSVLSHTILFQQL